MTITSSLIILFFTREKLPESIDIDELNPSRFSGNSAYLFLKEITQDYHCFTQKENIKVAHKIIEQVKNVKSKHQSSSLHIELDSSGYYKDSRTFFEASNIIITFNGKSDKFLLLSAHYDSVCDSYGATDDGSGVSVLVEITRNLAEYESKYGKFANSIVILLNNSEETGLNGSKHFVRNNPLWKKVIAFINIDGAGAGGKPILFRSSNLLLSQLYSNSAPYPHLNVVGNDVMRFHLLNSETDFAVYSIEKPGIDIAFYENRGSYHTMKDNIDNISSGSLQQLGSNILAMSLLLLNDEAALITIESKSMEDSVYFDILTDSAMCYSTTIYYCLICLSLVFLVILSAVDYKFYNPSNSNLNKSKPVKYLLGYSTQSFVDILFRLLLSLVFMYTFTDILLQARREFIFANNSWIYYALTFISIISSNLIISCLINSFFPESFSLLSEFRRSGLKIYLALWVILELFISVYFKVYSLYFLFWNILCICTSFSMWYSLFDRTGNARWFSAKLTICIYWISLLALQLTLPVFLTGGFIVNIVKALETIDNLSFILGSVVLVLTFNCLIYPVASIFDALMIHFSLQSDRSNQNGILSKIMQITPFLLWTIFSIVILAVIGAVVTTFSPRYPIKVEYSENNNYGELTTRNVGNIDLRKLLPNMVEKYPNSFLRWNCEKSKCSFEVKKRFHEANGIFTIVENVHDVSVFVRDCRMVHLNTDIHEFEKDGRIISNVKLLISQTFEFTLKFARQIGISHTLTLECEKSDNEETFKLITNEIPNNMVLFHKNQKFYSKDIQIYPL